MGHEDNTSKTQAMSKVDYDFNEALEHAGFGWFQFKLLILTGWVSAIEANEVLKVAFIIPILRDVWNLSMWQSNMIGISTFSGTVLGCFVWSKLSDIYGRRKTIIFATAVVAFCSLALGFTTNIITFLICTFLMNCGHSAVVACTLFLEFSPKNWRARSFVMYEVFWTIGGIYSVLLSWLTLPNFDLELGWRIYTWVSAGGASALALWALFIPESIRYLCTIGDFDNATKRIQTILETNGAEPMKGSLVMDKIVAVRGALKDLFVPKYRLTTIAIMQNYFTYGVVYYGAIFISEQVFINTSLYLCELIIAISELPSVPIGYFFIDKTGRKGMMIITMAINVICLSIAAVFRYFYQGNTWETYLNVVLIFSVRCSCHVYITALGAFICEYYPTAIRSSAHGFLRALGRCGAIVGILFWLDLDVVAGLAAMGIICLLSLLNHLVFEDTSNKDMSNAVEYVYKEKKRYLVIV